MKCVCVCLRSSKCHYFTLSHHVLTWTHGTMRRDFRNEDKSSFQHWLSRLYLLLSFKALSDLILLLCTERFSFSFSFQMELENNCSFQTLTFSALFQFSSVKIYLLFVLASFFPPFFVTSIFLVVNFSFSLLVLWPVLLLLTLTHGLIKS